MSTILLHWRYQLEVRATKKNLCILTPSSWNHGWRKLHVFICQLSADPCGHLIQLLVLWRLECEWLSAASKLGRLHSCSLCFWLFVKKISVNCCPTNTEQLFLSMALSSEEAEAHKNCLVLGLKTPAKTLVEELGHRSEPVCLPFPELERPSKWRVAFPAVTIIYLISFITKYMRTCF